MKYILQVDFYKKTHKTMPLILYEEDYGATIEFRTNLNLEEVEMVAFAITGRTTASVLIKTPSGKRIVTPSDSNGHIFSAGITPLMTKEIGDYIYQLRIEGDGFIYTSPELNYEVRPLVVEGGMADAIIDMFAVDEIHVSEDSYTYITQEGSYEKTEWVPYSTIISATRMNKIEDELEKLNIVKAGVNHVHEGYVEEEKFLEVVGGLATKEEVITKASATELREHTGDTVTHITSTERNRWNAKSDFSGDYEDLVNKPEVFADVDKAYVDSELEKKTDKTYTDIELAKKANLTDLDDLHTHGNMAVLEGVTAEKVSSWDNKSEFSGNYNDLSNKPTIPTVDVTKAYVDSGLALKLNIADSHIHINKTTLDGITAEKVSSWDNKSEFSGNYLDLSNRPYIPSNISDLTNDVGYITINHNHDSRYYDKATVDQKITDAVTGGTVDLSGYLTKLEAQGEYATIATVDNKVDKITGKGLSTNDYTTAEKNKLSGIAAGANNYSLPTATASILGGVKIGSNILINSGVISTHDPYTHPAAHEASMITQSSNYRFVSDIEKNTWNNKSNFSGNYNDLTNKPVIPTVDVTKSYVDTGLGGKVDKVNGKDLSTNDYTDAEKDKLNNLSNYTHPTEHEANIIKFSDGEDLQEKLDNGKLGGGGAVVLTDGSKNYVLGITENGAITTEETADMPSGFTGYIHPSSHSSFIIKMASGKSLEQAFSEIESGGGSGSTPVLSVLYPYVGLLSEQTSISRKNLYKADNGFHYVAELDIPNWNNSGTPTSKEFSLYEAEGEWKEIRLMTDDGIAYIVDTEENKQAMREIGHSITIAYNIKKGVMRFEFNGNAFPMTVKNYRFTMSEDGWGGSFEGDSNGIKRLPFRLDRGATDKTPIDTYCYISMYMSYRVNEVRYDGSLMLVFVGDNISTRAYSLLIPIRL